MNAAYCSMLSHPSKGGANERKGWATGMWVRGRVTNARRKHCGTTRRMLLAFFCSAAAGPRARRRVPRDTSHHATPYHTIHHTRHRPRHACRAKSTPPVVRLPVYDDDDDDDNDDDDYGVYHPTLGHFSMLDISS